MSNYTGSVPDTATRPTDWLAKAPCKADPDAMFPGTNDHDIAYAKSICRRCPAIERCLQWALDTGEEHGVWGGLSEKERRRIRRRAARPISVDDYTGTPRTPSQCRSLEDVWKDGTEPAGEHLLWTGRKAVHRPRGQSQITPNRLAFYLDRGHWPEGEVRRTCGVDGCVLPGHLEDRREASEQAGAAA